jgi:hypothetical protein
VSADTHATTVRVAPSVAVLVREGGARIPNRPAAPSLPLPMAGLALLAELSVDEPPPLASVVEQVAQRCRVEVDEVRSIADKLQRRGHVVASDSRGVAPREPLAVVPQHPLPELVQLLTPIGARAAGGRFELVDHDGACVASLRDVELAALECLVAVTAIDAAYDAHRGALGPLALDRPAFDELVGRLLAVGLAAAPSGGSKELRAGDRTHWSEAIEGDAIREVFHRRALEHERAERAREEASGVRRPKVIPVAFDPGPPLGLGLIIANAKAHAGGILDEHYDFRLDFIYDDRRIPSYTEHPAVYMFSNYLWSHKQCVDVSEHVKRLSPDSITIHGGPDTPKYPGDVEAYFAAHPHVDITVRGEGEATTTHVLDALRAVVGDERPDLSVLADVPGIAYRDGDRVVRTADRERIADLDTVPSPFLTGLFDAYAEVPGAKVTIETNRGCPYGCTFCDWGSATLSRIRKYDLDRVYAELEWCARANAYSVGPADANFGIFERDVQIAERLAELKRAHGAPQVFGVSYAKNTVKHLRHIIQLMADAEIVTQGILSLQSMDEGTLDAVHRSNIKTEKYDELAGEFRRADLPLFVDLMLGLPGQTVASFMSDLQQCIDREVQVRIPRTTLLVNSPMNDPDYRSEYQIVTNTAPGPGKIPLVVSTSTFTRDDYREMTRLRLDFLLFENFGVLRQVARFVHQETGVREVDFYDRLRRDAEADPNRWPHLYLTVAMVPETMCAPVSWRLVIDELHEYLVGVLGVADDGALRTVLTVQHALLPAHGRSLPIALDLEHDFAAWQAAVLAVKESPDRQAWTTLVPRLAAFGPGEFKIDDSSGSVATAIGADIEMHGFGLNWEYESPVRRAFRARGRASEAYAAP